MTDQSRTLTGAVLYAIHRRLRSLRSLTGGYEWSRPAGEKVICGFVWALTTPALSAETRKTLLKEAFGMEMTQVVEKQIDDFDWMLESYGRERFAAEKKQCREEGEQSGFKKGVKIGFARGEQSGFEKGEQSGFEKGSEQATESIAIEMLKTIIIWKKSAG